MSNARFLQDGFEKRLSHFIEECGEALAAAGKLQRFGKYSVNPLAPGETNLEWLKREVSDVIESAQRLEQTIRQEAK